SPALVNELLTQEMIGILRSHSTLVDLDYTFFEGWKSRNNFPGFAVYGRDAQARVQKERGHVLSVKYCSADLADRINVSERFMTDPGTSVSSVLSYRIEVPATSPLNPDPLDPRWDSSNPYQGLAQLLEKLTNRENADLAVTKPETFYQSFEGSFDLKHFFDEILVNRLQEKDPLTNAGRYLLLVTLNDEGAIKFERGNFLDIFGDGACEGICITSQHYLEERVFLSFYAHEIVALYGKGLESFYFAEKLRSR
ncbi:MAG: hypothetical protein KC548_06375, partial [Nanoarchaeota archaeon]|nr:hypothetical protein [Nanoarchaeota archaeon]